MRIANLSGRLVLVAGGRAVDVHQASEGRFGPDPQAVYDRWAQFSSWAGQADVSAGEAFDAADLGAPAPAPRQLLAAGLNYRDHPQRWLADGDELVSTIEGIGELRQRFAAA